MLIDPEVEHIVRDLAQVQLKGKVCPLCLAAIEDINNTTFHDRTCPYRRAREWAWADQHAVDVVKAGLKADPADEVHCIRTV